MYIILVPFCVPSVRHHVSADTDAITIYRLYRLYIRLWFVSSTSRHQLLVQRQLSHIRSILPETFHYTTINSGSIGLSGDKAAIKRLLFVFLNLAFFWNITSSKYNRAELRGTKSYLPAEKQEAPLVGEAPKRAPPPEIPPTDEALRRAHSV